VAARWNCSISGYGPGYAVASKSVLELLVGSEDPLLDVVPVAELLDVKAVEGAPFRVSG
jgi:hypothetical protein